MEEKTLALEMLGELKRKSEQEERNAIRWFWAFIITLILWFATIGIFIWYINQPIEETITYSQDATATNDSSVDQNIGE